MKENVRGLLAAYLASAMMSGVRPREMATEVGRIYHPWDKINLTKSERKGKTPDEIQAMRKARWTALQVAGHDS